MNYKGRVSCSITYQEAEGILSHGRDKDYRTIGNHTHLVRQDNGDICIRHWSTDIITFKKNGNVALDSHGYHTVTTGARYRNFFDIAPFTYKGDWVTYIKGILYIFDGLELAPDQGEWKVVNGRPYIASSMEVLLGKKIPDTESLIQIVRDMGVDQLLKIWKKFKLQRGFLATYCKPEFLPLTMATVRKNAYGGTSWKDEEWQKIVTERLRKDAA
jgi:hypothetical protein